MSDTLTYTITAIPTASKYMQLLDSTKGLISMDTTSTSAAPTPGSFRGRWAKFRRAVFNVRNGDQAVSLVFLKSVQPTLTTASMWAADTDSMGGASSITHALSTNDEYSWLIPSPDFSAYVLAGGTAPSAFQVQVTLHCDPEPGI